MNKDGILADYPEILMPRDVQRILHISRSTLYKHLASGTIRAIKIGKSYRVPKRSLEEFLYPDKGGLT